jgi:undecaprenyl-diphosphatase
MAFLHQIDLSIFHALNNLAGKSPLSDAAILFLASYLAYVLIALFIALILFSRHEKRLKIEIFLTALVSALIARFGIASLIRFFYHRPRPFTALQIHPLFTDPAWSFPSGHATFFFALATAMYFYNKRWGIGFFIGAILITLGRVAAGVHYPSDIAAGAVIGMLVAYLTFRLFNALAQKWNDPVKIQ